MKKSKLFDIIVYRMLFSIPVSCFTNFIYGFVLFLAFWAWSEPFGVSLKNFEYKIFVLLISVASIVPCIALNMIRYIAIKGGYLKYGIKALLLSWLPEYLFFMILILFSYISKIS